MKRRRKWPPAVGWLRTALIVAALIISLPVTFPVAMIQHARMVTRRRRCAERTGCVRCGRRLGEEALRMANEAWAAYTERLHQDHPGVMFRLVRETWAVCPTCGQEHGYDERTDRFYETASSAATKGLGPS